ncbi:MAG: TolC family protein [Planctomycetota bacterium]
MKTAVVCRAFCSVVVLLLMIPAVAGWTSQAGAQPPATTPPATPTKTADLPEPDGPPLRPVPLSIEKALHIALEMNLELRTERFTRDSAENDIAIALSVFDPLFNTSYTVSKFRQPTVSFLSGVGAGASVTVNPFESSVFSLGVSGLLPAGTNWGLSLVNTRSDNPESTFFSLNPRNEMTLRAEITQPLLKNFWTNSNLADYRISQNNLEISREQYRRLVETTVSDVHNAYWDLVFAQRDLEVKEESLTEAERLLEINRQKLDVGTATEIDVYDAEANIETQKSGIIDARAQLERAQDDLLDLLNYGEYLQRNDEEVGTEGPYGGIRVVPSTPLSFAEYPIQLGQAQGLALRNRSELKQANFVHHNADLELQRRKNQMLPTFNVVGSWDQEGLDENFGNTIDGVGTGRFYSWSIGLVFEHPIGNRAEKNQLAKARNSLRAAELDIDRTRNTVVKEVRQAVRDIRSARQRVQTTRSAMQLRREQLNGETQRLRVGSSTSYQVLQVQNDLLEAQSLEIQAQVDYKKAVTAFERATGIILSTSGIIIE